MTYPNRFRKYKKEIQWLLDNGFTIFRMDSSCIEDDVFIARKALTENFCLEISIYVDTDLNNFYRSCFFEPVVFDKKPLPLPTDAGYIRKNYKTGTYGYFYEAPAGHRPLRQFLIETEELMKNYYPDNPRLRDYLPVDGLN